MASKILSFADLKVVSEVVADLYLRSGSPRYTAEEQALFKKQAEELEADLKILVRVRFNKSTQKFKNSKKTLNAAFKKLKGELAALKKASAIVKSFGEAAKALDGLLTVAAGIAGKALPG